VRLAGWNDLGDYRGSIPWRTDAERPGPLRGMNLIWRLPDGSISAGTPSPAHRIVWQHPLPGRSPSGATKLVSLQVAQETTIPDLSDMTLGAARRVAERAGLRVRVMSSGKPWEADVFLVENHRTSPPGEIITMGGTVGVIIVGPFNAFDTELQRFALADSEDGIALPRFVGRGYGWARNWCWENRLRLFSNVHPSGDDQPIIGQTPPAGEVVFRGSTVGVILVTLQEEPADLGRMSEAMLDGGPISVAEDTPETPEPTGPPWQLWLGAAAVLLLFGGAVGYALHRR